MIPKTLVISDLHFTNKFDQKKYDFLERLISKFDQVIINGDLWCVLTINFDEFLGSGWKHLFPLLKSKKTIYLSGNHDPAKFTDDRVFLFCDQHLKEYVLKDDPFVFHIQHGPKLLKRDYPEDEPTINFLKLIRFQPIMVTAQKIALKTLGLTSVRLASQGDNNILRKLAQKLSDNNFLVTGHTHLPEFDPQNKFINTGFIGEGFASYLAIYGDSFELITKKY